MFPRSELADVLRQTEALLVERPRLRFCWRIVVAFAVIRLVLLSAFMVDPRFDLGALPGDSFYRSHSCLTAYWQAASLARDHVVNLYDANLYENRTIDGFGIDAYLYPPPFLLWPRGAALLSDRFMTVRAGWYIVELGLFLWSFGFVAVWMGGRSGARCLLWLPVVATSLPVLLGLQMGNFHLAAIALAMLGMLAVEQDQNGRAGFYLAVATGAKIFPAILLVLLACRGKLRPVVLTAIWLAAQTAGAIILFGTAPLRSFFDFQLSQLFAIEAGPWEAPALFGTVNSSIFGLALKVRAAGFPIGSAGASAMAWLYSLGLFCAAVGAGIKQRGHNAATAQLPNGDEGRQRAARTWVALLALASLRAPFIPDAYAGVAALWLLALVGCYASRTRTVGLALALSLLWPVLPSRLALPGFESLRLVFTLAAQLTMLALASAVAWSAVRAGARRPPAALSQ